MQNSNNNEVLPKSEPKRPNMLQEKNIATINGLDEIYSLALTPVVSASGETVYLINLPSDEKELNDINFALTQNGIFVSLQTTDLRENVDIIAEIMSTPDSTDGASTTFVIEKDTTKLSPDLIEKLKTKLNLAQSSNERKEAEQERDPMEDVTAFLSEFKKSQTNN